MELFSVVDILRPWIVDVTGKFTRERRFKILTPARARRGVMKLDIRDGIVEYRNGKEIYYPIEGGVWEDNKQVAGTSDKPYRFKVGELVRQGKISWYRAKKQLLEVNVHGVYQDTKLRDI
jgi:hypothetical protein